MNLPGRNLLSLTVYHLRRVVRLVIGVPTTPEPGEVKPGEGGGTVVGGGGATPGDDVEVTLPGGETGSGEVGEGGEWEVEFPEVPHDPSLDIGDVDVTTKPKPGEPVIEVITPNPDGSVTVGGGGAKPGETVEVTFPDGSVGSGTANDNGNWTVTSPTPQPPDLDQDDLAVVSKPDPWQESVSGSDAIWMEILNYDFVECDDAGNYIVYETIVEIDPLSLVDTMNPDGYEVTEQGRYITLG
ncbi:hypothetical protein NOV18_08675 [Pseudomonas asiatica]|uniref:Bacterial Ig domain-containing protein n=1 Tax=Pseudomonas asiatica TaxID=2219225 RepID=A0AAJ5IPP5_9PSED|nr:hypothetical protein [Pseudomonas asiatica]UUC20538.1 hypothetical protein NOV18_08675 [Pseudomonas asiatica]